jgi:hypothetical protein
MTERKNYDAYRPGKVVRDRRTEETAGIVAVNPVVGVITVAKPGSLLTDVAEHYEVLDEDGASS